MECDHYATLGVHDRSDTATIRAAYLRVMRDTHPDRRPDDAAAIEAARAANAAWEVLGNPERRAAYDRQRAAGDRPRNRPASTAGPQGVEVWRAGSAGGMRATTPSNQVHSDARAQINAQFHAASLRMAVGAFIVGVVLLVTVALG